MALAVRPLLVAMVSLLLLLCPIEAGAADPTSGGLHFIDPSDLSTSTTKLKTKETVTIRNDGPSADVKLALVPGKAGLSVQTVGSSTVAGNSVGRIRIVITNESAKAYEGYLVARAAGATSATLALSVSAPQRVIEPWRYLAPLGASALLVLLPWVILRVRTPRRRSPYRLSSRFGPVNWEYSKSWASIVGVLAAILTAVAAEKLLPERTDVSDKTYAGLSLFFAVMIVVAPLLYTALQTMVELKPEGRSDSGSRESKASSEQNTDGQGLPRRVVQRIVGRGEPRKPQDPQMQGFVYAFLLASILTLGGVVGQGLTALLWLGEVRAADAVPDLVVNLMRAGLLLLGILLAWYAITTVRAILVYQCVPEEALQLRQVHRAKAREGIDLSIAEARPQRSSWSVL